MSGKTLADEIIETAQRGARTEDSAKWKRFQDMFDATKNMNLISDFRRKDIDRFGDLEMIDNYLKRNWLIDIYLAEDTQREKEQLVSHDRGGRKEGFSVLKQDIQIKKEPSKLETVLGV